MPWALHALKFLTESKLDIQRIVVSCTKSPTMSDTGPMLQEECIDGGAIEACILHFKSAPLDNTRTTAQELKHAAESLHYLITTSAAPNLKQKAVQRLNEMEDIIETLVCCSWSIGDFCDA